MLWHRGKSSIPYYGRFIRRIWGKKGIDKVIALGKGLFIVRLKTIEQ